MEVNENRGRLGRKNFRGKSVKRGNRLKEKDITGSVKRANHNKGSMIVFRPTELVQPGGNNHSSRFVRLCVGPPVSFMGQADTLCIHFPLPAKETAKKENHLVARKSTSWHRRKRKGHCFISLNIV